MCLLRLRCRELAQIGISSGLISEADGNAIKELLRKGPVSVALNWTDVLPKAKQVAAAAAAGTAGTQAQLRKIASSSLAGRISTLAGQSPRFSSRCSGTMTDQTEDGLCIYACWHFVWIVCLLSV
jgi:hypothetical protein